MNHAAIDHRLTADTLTHTAAYMAALGPAHTCLYRRAGDDAAIRLSGYGPLTTTPIRNWNPPTGRS